MIPTWPDRRHLGRADLPDARQRRPRHHAERPDLRQRAARRVRLSGHTIVPAEAAGIPRDRIIVDPGIGFGKTLDHNLTCCADCRCFTGWAAPILLGASRKRFIGTMHRHREARDRTAGSSPSRCTASAQGVQILRVHDTVETRQALRLQLSNGGAADDTQTLWHRRRARAGKPHPMTAEMALKIGAAAGRYFRNDGSNGHRVVIGKDTRLSGYMFENALTAGLTSTGMNVLLLGQSRPRLSGF